VVDLSLATQAEGVTERDVRGDRAVFGLNEGLDAVLGLLSRNSLKATFPVPGVMVKTYGERLGEILAEGHEIAVHGYSHEDLSMLEPAQEAERLTAATGMVAEVTGTRPAGFFALPRASDPFAVGTVSPHTIGLLIEAGYRYFGNGLADDAPYYWVSDFDVAATLLTLPYYYHFDDQFFLMFPSRGSGLEHADALHANWRAEFEAQYERGRYFHMVLHPHAIGWCNRLRRLEAFLGALTERKDIWNATGAECADYWLKRYPAAESLELAPSIWQHHPGSLS
jgi:peptidoglycan/xylan/chitin deacetylase (PgdA/CDA1 family)